MAFDAKTHGVVHFSLGDRLRVHVAVALGAVHARANVRGVIELYVRGRLESVNALPGDVFSARAIGRELLDLGLVGGDHLMAGHAEIDAGDAGVGPLIDAHVAIGTLHSIREMHFVRVGDGLDGFCPRAEEFPDRFGDRAMRRRENRRSLRGGLG